MAHSRCERDSDENRAHGLETKTTQEAVPAQSSRMALVMDTYPDTDKILITVRVLLPFISVRNIEFSQLSQLELQFLHQSKDGLRLHHSQWKSPA